MALGGYLDVLQHLPGGINLVWRAFLQANRQAAEKRGVYGIAFDEGNSLMSAVVESDDGSTVI